VAQSLAASLTVVAFTYAGSGLPQTFGLPVL